MNDSKLSKMDKIKFKLKASMERSKKLSNTRTATTFILIEETFYELFSPIKFSVSLVVMLIYPIILITFPTSVDFGSISIQHASSIITVALVFPVFFWTFGIIFTSIIGIFGAALIAEEVSSGTMLILVSKPINRYKIFLGKYVALFLYGILLSFSAIFLLGLISIFRYSGNIYHFVGILPFLFSLFLYTFVLSLIFVSITLALSSIFKKSRNAVLVIIFLVVLSFLGFSIIIELIHFNYEKFQIYHFNLGYHLGNMYISFIELFNAIPPSSGWQSIFAQMFGIFRYLADVDPDQNINLGGLEKTNYYLPIVSLLIWIIIAILLLLYGLISLKKREISG